MKPLIQKLPLAENRSFIARTFRSPEYEVGWHQHVEYELIFFKEGVGLAFIGNQVTQFKAGDVFFLGSNLPHTFQKSDFNAIASAVVVQFCGDFWGADFLDLPESKLIKSLLSISAAGLKLLGRTRKSMGALITQLETAEGFNRVILLAQCLNTISSSGEFQKVSTQEVKVPGSKSDSNIDRIFQYTIDNFKDPVSLAQIAAVACLSVPAFCNYFKKSTKKTYVDFLNETRIGYACSLLTNTWRPILEIGYESGYNTLANFHRQFFKIKGVTPLQYRKSFMKHVSLPQNNIGIEDRGR